jgi:flagellar hook-associated protein 1
MGIASILNIAKNAMAASQTSVQVTSHNVANVNTAGYSRQEAVLEEAPPMPTASGLLGNGVVINGITRYCDKFLDSAIASKNGTLQEQQTAQKYFERVQSILKDDNSNL